MSKTRANMASKQSSPTMKWTPEMRMGLLAAALITRSQWASVTRLWYDEFVHRIPGLANVESLAGRLRSQYGMIEMPNGQKTWAHIPKTLLGLAQESPGMISRLQDAASSLGIARYTVEVSVHPLTAPSPDQQVQPSSSADAEMGNSRSTTPNPDLMPPLEGLNIAQYSLEPLLSSSEMTSGLPVAPDSENNGPEVAAVVLPSSRPTVSAPHTPVAAMSHVMPQTAVSEGRRAQTMLGGFPRRAPGQPTSEYLAERRSMVHGPYRPIPHEVLHPPLPTLLYRYYNTADSHVGNFPLGKGFISGWYENVCVHQGEPAPLDGTVDFLWHCVEIHWNQRKFPTPFVSVTSNLHWAVTRAAEKSTSGKNMRISMIDANAATGENRSRAYHLSAFHEQLRERGAFDDLSKMMYRGKYEFLIWHSIPGSAIVHDFSYTDFANFTRSVPRVQSIFKLHELEIPRQGGSDKIRKRWRSDPVDLLDELTVPALVDVLLWLYCGNEGNMISLEDAVTDLANDLIFGWVLRPSQSPSGQEWMDMSQAFSLLLHDKLQLQQTEASVKKIARAFLFGVMAGLAEDGWSGAAPKRRASRHSGSRRQSRQSALDTPTSTPVQRRLSQYAFVPTNATDIESPTVQRQQRMGAINWTTPNTPTSYSRFFGHDLDGMELDDSSE